MTYRCRCGHVFRLKAGDYKRPPDNLPCRRCLLGWAERESNPED